MENVTFSINSRILEHLGKDLITSDEIAITELIKNSYDAKADLVKLYFFDSEDFINSEKFLNPLDLKVKDAVIESLQVTKRVIVLEDNGDGMGRDDLIEGFFTIGTDIKKKKKVEKETNNDRLPLGEKGIGRLAAQRLSRVLIMETTNAVSEKTHIVKINWSDFLESESLLEDIKMQYFQLDKKQIAYTRLWFVDSYNNFDDLIDDKRSQQLNLFEEEHESQLQISEEFGSLLGFLISPFEEKKEKFNIQIYLNNELVTNDFNGEIINIAETLHSFSFNQVNDKDITLKMEMNLKPWYLERVHSGLMEADVFKDWKLDSKEYNKLLNENLEHYSKSLILDLNIEQFKNRFKIPSDYLDALKILTPISGKVYSFKRSGKLSAMAISSAKNLGQLKRKFTIQKVARFLEAHNGVKLYRNTNRVTTLGDKDSDWLQLQQERTKGQQFFRFELGNVIGYVSVNDPYQHYIKETSSRLNLSDNQHSKILLSFLKTIFNDIFYSFSQSAFYITKEILKDKKLVPERSLDNLKITVNNTNIQFEETSKKIIELDKAYKSLKSTLQGHHDPNVKTALEYLNATTKSFKDAFHDTTIQLKRAGKLVSEVESERKLIQVESYNNYKLMANGLVTEVLTHELHSIFSNINNSKDQESHFDNIIKYLLEHDQYLLISEHLNPISEDYSFMRQRMKELGNFYELMEKTFLRNGTADEFVNENLKSFLSDLESRLENRLKERAVTIDYSTIDMTWFVPKGVLVHIFYNLIDNSLHWIHERKNKQKQDKIYSYSEKERIQIQRQDEGVIYYSDTGTGVLGRMENTLFQPLVSGKEKGRGLGMYITRNLLRSFGGDIELLPDRNVFGNRYIFAIYLKKEEIN
ncbi:ATP-binding protein [Paenibacillus sp. Z6-24]